MYDCFRKLESKFWGSGIMPAMGVFDCKNFVAQVLKVEENKQGLGMKRQ